MSPDVTFIPQGFKKIEGSKDIFWYIFPLPEPQALTPDDMVSTEAQKKSSRCSCVKGTAQSQVESESGMVQPILRQKVNIPHLAPSMDVDDEESDMNNAQDIVAQPVSIDNGSNHVNQLGHEATEMGDEGEVSDGTADIKMVSHAMNQSEHPTFEGEEFEDLDKDDNVTIIAHTHNLCACVELMCFKISEVCITCLGAVQHVNDGLPHKINMK
ncbi:hypothetical protein APHAL10511_005724 [Amanita phalloides]|nr:hypothetical protein APHAL10511_005724 [Amanita phalloides]